MSSIVFFYVLWMMYALQFWSTDAPHHSGSWGLCSNIPLICQVAGFPFVVSESLLTIIQCWWESGRSVTYGEEISHGSVLWGFSSLSSLKIKNLFTGGSDFAMTSVTFGLSNFGIPNFPRFPVLFIFLTCRIRALSATPAVPSNAVRSATVAMPTDIAATPTRSHTSRARHTNAPMA